MKMTTAKHSSHHVPRLKLFGIRHNCLSSSVFKIVFFIFLLGLIGAASQDSAVLKISAQHFNQDFRGSTVKSSHLPLSSVSSLETDDEVELQSLFESRRENMSLLDQPSLIHEFHKNQTVIQSSSVPTASNTLISSENKSTFREKEIENILSKNKRSKVVVDNYSGETSELISSERNNSRVSSSEEVENQIELLRVVTHSFESSTEISTLKEGPRFRSHNMWTNQSLLENQLFDEEGHSHSDEEEDFHTSSEKPLKYISSAKRPRRSVMHLYDMVMCGTGGCNPLAYKGYGCYCGFLGSGLPVDGIDRCCAKHDWCYHHAKCPPLLTYFVPYYWTCNEGRPSCVSDYRGWKGVCGAHLCECDRLFAQCLQKYPCPRSRAMCMTSPWRFWQNLVMQPPYG